MKFAWLKKAQPQILIEKLMGNRNIVNDKVSFSAFEFNEQLPVLCNMLEIDRVFPRDVLIGFVMKALFQPVVKLSHTELLQSINKQLHEYNQKAEENYVLITTINLLPSNKIPSMKLQNCKISFHFGLPKRYINGRLKAISNVSSWLISEDEKNCLFVKVCVSAKSFSEAANKALSSLDLLRGIWCLRHNKVMRFSSGGVKQPVNTIRLGALHTLHLPNGNLATETFWFEPNYFKSHAREDLSSNNYLALRFAKNVFKDLSKKSYKDELEIGIIKLVRSLDGNDLSSCLIKLWSTMEYLTQTLFDSYDKTIRRAVFLWVDQDFHKQILENLRNYRNSTVHSGSDYNDCEVFLYQLKGYVEKLLCFHIGVKFKFKDFSEACFFLDNNSDLEFVKRQRKKLSFCIDFLSR